MKTLIAACIDQVLVFDTTQAFDKYIEDLKWKKHKFKILKQVIKADGSVHIRIKRQYNATGDKFMEMDGDEYI